MQLPHRRLAFFTALGVAVIFAVLWFGQHRRARLVVSGIVEADEARVGSRVGGRVWEVYAFEGQEVKPGDLLLELEPFDLPDRLAEAQAQAKAARADYELALAGFRTEEVAAARAKRDEAKAAYDQLVTGPRQEEIRAQASLLKQAQAELELAKTEYARTKGLWQKNVLPKQELERVNSRLQSSQAAVEGAAAKLEELEEGTRSEEIARAKAALEAADQELRRLASGSRGEEIRRVAALLEAAEAHARALEKQRDELLIHAPITGRVDALKLVVGNLIAPNAPALTIIDHRRLWVQAFIPEEIAGLQVGQEVDVAVPAARTQVRGRVSYVADTAEFTPNNYQSTKERVKLVYRTKITLDTATAEGIRPGMFADITFRP